MKLQKYLVLEKGLLFWTVQLKHQVKPTDQLVLPYKFRKRMVLACHDKMGHLGIDCTLQTEASYPLELVHVDFLLIGGKKDIQKEINVLVVTDHFTRYAQAYVTTSQMAVTADKAL